jgi:cobalt-zinc-cadmium efflux system membrane fusion protein
MSEGSNAQPQPANHPAPPNGPPARPPELEEAKRHASAFFKVMQSAGLLLIVGVVLLVFIGFVLGVPIPGMHHAEPEAAAKAKATLGVRLAEGQPHTLLVPSDVRESLGIRKAGKDQTHVVRVPTENRPLVLYGNTALDPARLMRIRARFAPAEVVSLGQVHDLDEKTGRSEFRDLRHGDRVSKGDVLGVFFSVDVGSKKNDLLDALVQLELDQKIYDRALKADKRGALPEVFLLNAWRSVQGDRNAINRALNNLTVWNIPQEDIDDLHAEAKKISADKDAWFRTREGRWVKGEKHKGDDPDKNPWGKVTLRAPFDGVIVECNVVPKEMVVDNTVNLFQIAQVKRLLVIANAPEDELPNLNALTRGQRRWKVKTVGPRPSTELKGTIDTIGYLIDPNQHTAIIKGYIDNPSEQIRAGQFISATVDIPPPDGVVEVPIDAVVEDGQSCVVFVRADPDKHHYTMRRVQLTHRFEKTAFVRSTRFAAKEQPTAEEREQGMLSMAPLLPGERILKTGVGELKAALLDLESRPAEAKLAKGE